MNQIATPTSAVRADVASVRAELLDLAPEMSMTSSEGWKQTSPSVRPSCPRGPISPPPSARRLRMPRSCDPLPTSRRAPR